MKSFWKPISLALAVSLFATHVPMALAATPDDQLVIGTSLVQVLSLDPQQGVDAKTVEILTNTYDRLVYTDNQNGNAIAPQLAEKWDIADDSITFHLREAKFASGNTVTANDVVFSLVRLMKLDQASAANFKTAGFSADNIESMVSAVDERTFRIQVPKTVVPEALLYRMSMGVASVVDSVEVLKHVNNGDYGNEWLRTNTAGSGPFTLRRWTPNDLVMLEANKDHWEGTPTLRRVIMRHVPESQAARLMLERGDIDIANALSASDIGYFQNKDGFTLDRVQTGGFYVLSMNAGREELAKPIVRKAIANSIDYAGIEKTIVGAYGQVRNVPVPADWAGAVKNPDWGFHPEEAKKMLAEAGYPNGFDVTLKVVSQAPRVDMATAIQANLAEVGIRVTIQQGNGADIVAAHRARDFDLLIPQTSAYMPTALGALDNFAYNPNNSAEAKNAGNFVWRSAWDIPEISKLRDEANAERDDARRQELVTEIQDKFIAASPAVLPMFERFEPIALNARVNGYSGHPMGMSRLNKVTKSDAQ